MVHKKDKLLLVLILLVIITALTACGKSKTKETISEESPVTADTDHEEKSDDAITANNEADAGKVTDNENGYAPTITDSPSPSVSEPAQTVETDAADKPKEAESSGSAENNKSAEDNALSETDQTSNTENDESEKKIVAIDAGHQRKGNYDKEPIGPGAKTTKAKVSSGTQGRFTGVPEYELNLVVAKKVKDELINRGYEVIMIRESHDVDLSNKERADIANESGADIFIRIHANGSTNPSVHGTLTIYPSDKNPYVADLSDASYKLSKAIVDAICEITGSKNRGAIARDDMSGINWSKIPVTIIEMGYMTNEKEDKLMQTVDYQDKIAQGICNGIDDYFRQ